MIDLTDSLNDCFISMIFLDELPIILIQLGILTKYLFSSLIEQTEWLPLLTE
jgi:hypothetical protein